MKLMKMKNRKGVLGLETATAFVLAIFILAVITFAVLVSLGAVVSTDVTGNTKDGVTGAGGFANQTIQLRDTGDVPSAIRDISGALTISLTDVLVTGNKSDNTSIATIATGNYTINATGGFFSTDATMNNTALNVTGVVNYKLDGVARGVSNNVSSGLQTLFNSSVTWFALIAIVILILIIAVVILAVRGFGGGGRL